MLDDDQVTYYRHRLETERRLAAESPSECVRLVHDELAGGYARVLGLTRQRSATERVSLQAARDESAAPGSAAA